MKEHPFKKMSRGYQERAAAEEVRQYEESRIAYLLKALNMPKAASRLREEEHRHSGDVRLTCRAFNERYTSFPVLLGTSILGGVKLHLDKTALLPALFRQFDQAPFVRAYEDFFEQHQGDAEGRVLGLVFPRKGIRQGLIILNEELEAVPYHGLTLVYSGGNRKHPCKLYVRPFQLLVEAIYRKGHGWRP